MRGNHRAAIDLYTRAAKIAPTDTGVWVSRGHCWAALGEFDRAIDDYTKTLDLWATHPDALWWRGQTRFRKGDREGGIADLEEQARLHPKNYKSLAVLAELYYAAGRTDRAIETATRALDLKSGYGHALLIRGLARARDGARAEAEADLEAAIRALGSDGRERRLTAEKALARLRQR